jgi:uncharacterized protein (DUF1697 family)
MPTYGSMLRGINVGGQKSMKMDQLRELFAALGFEQVRTYVQSGNVVFKARKSSPADLSRKIEERILSEFGFSVSVISKTAEEIGRTIQNNPFLKEKAIDPEKLHVTFLSQVPAKTALQKLDALSTAPDRFHSRGAEIYLFCPNGYGRTRLSNNVFEKLLALRATTRNWKTVNQLYRIATE